MAIISKLAKLFVDVGKSNARTETISKITVHHMAGVMSAEDCALMHKNNDVEQSANYYIGVEGDTACGVPEERRAWTSGGTDVYGNETCDPITGMTGRENDYQAITIECSNCEYGGEWALSEATWDSLVALCVDICKRYDFKLDFTGAGDGSLTMHKIFAPTACPGDWLEERMVLLEKTVNEILDKKEEDKMTQEEKEMMVKMECNEWLHRDPDEKTLKDLCELIPDDVEYDAFNTSALDDMLENSAEARQLHRIEAIKAFYRTCLGREASDAEAYGWESGEDASLRKIYKYIYNSDEAEAYRKRHFTA